MNWSILVKIGLQLLAWIIREKLNAAQQRELGRDDAVREALNALNERVKVAREIDADSERWSDDDVDSILFTKPDGEPDSRK